MSTVSETIHPQRVCREVLPLIRREVSGTTLTICGSLPNVRVKSLVKNSRCDCHRAGSRRAAFTCRERASRWCHYGSREASRTNYWKQWR